jgi:aspartyl-tRNA(Asn)/glutamyl-tRNA(Gln) amidotransferase subunit B
LQDFSAALKIAGKNPDETFVTPENLAELILMISRGEVSSAAAKQIFKVMFEKGGDPSEIVKDLGLSQVSDATVIEAAIDKVLSENEKAVQDFKAGQEKSFGFLVGQCMKELKGQGNPSLVNEVLRKKLQ